MSRHVVINIMHNIYVYIHWSLNSRNVWPSESEKLERSEFVVVVVVRCGGETSGERQIDDRFRTGAGHFGRRLLYTLSAPSPAHANVGVRRGEGGGINTCTVNDRTRVSSTLFFYPSVSIFYSLFFFLSFFRVFFTNVHTDVDAHPLSLFSG